MQDSAPPGIRKFATQALINLAEAHDAIIENHVFQTHYANKQRSAEPQITKGELVYLSTKNLNLPKGHAQKLCPKFIGPYKVEAASPETSTYTLQLPKALQDRRIHPTFHISLLRPYHANNDALFSNRDQPEPYDFGAPDDTEWFIDEVIGHQWIGRSLELHIRWSLGDTTWEPLANCNELAALDHYLEIMGVKFPRQLSKRAMSTPISIPIDTSKCAKKRKRECLFLGTDLKFIFIYDHNIAKAVPTCIDENLLGICPLRYHK